MLKTAKILGLFCLVFMASGITFCLIGIKTDAKWALPAAEVALVLTVVIAVLAGVFYEKSKGRSESTSEETTRPRAGQTVVFTSREELGSDYYLRARATVITSGETSCLIKITKILRIGQMNMTIVGDRFPATYSELEVLPE